MKTLKTLLTAALFASVAVTGTAQADNSLSNLIYDQSSNIYSEVSHQNSTSEGVLSYSVWINQYLGSDPAAAGKNNGSTFIYNETAGEYHLQ